MRRIGRLLLLDVHEELCASACCNRMLSRMGQHFLGVGHWLLTVAASLSSEGAFLNVLHCFLYPHVGLGRGVHLLVGLNLEHEVAAAL